MLVQEEVADAIWGSSGGNSGGIGIVLCVVQPGVFL